MKADDKALPTTAGIVLTNEYERLKREVYRSDMEKFRLFTQMLRTNMKLKKAVIHHK